jgi:phospholipase A1
MKIGKPLLGCAAGLVLVVTAVFPAFANPMDDCILEMFAKSGNSMTIGEIKKVCSEPQDTIDVAVKETPLSRRLDIDGDNTLKPFTLMAHKPNFFMVTYDDSREDIENWGTAGGPTASLDNVELQFQVSIKTPLAINILDKQIDMYAAYTNRSFWQAFNDEDQNSSFFRETNHEPEFWIQQRHDYELPLGINYKITALGFVHQSNGRAGDHSVNDYALSRSWNRVYANFILERGNFVMAIKPWARIKEKSKDDDNPNITDYLGHGELRLAYKYEEHTFALMSRNNLESSFSKGAIEASWSFPLWNYPYVKGYIQYFSGYGESLADYDQYNNRIGLGVALSDWL